MAPYYRYMDYAKGSRFFLTGRQESILRCTDCSTYTSPLGHCGLRVQVHCTLAGSIPAGHEKRILRWAGFNTPLKALTCAGPLLCAPARRAHLSSVLWRSVLRARNRTRKSECTALLVNHHDAAQSAVPPFWDMSRPGSSPGLNMSQKDGQNQDNFLAS